MLATMRRNLITRTKIMFLVAAQTV